MENVPEWRIPQGAMERFDQKRAAKAGQTPGEEDAVGQTKHSLAQQAAHDALTAEGFSPDEKERICTLAAAVVPDSFFRYTPEAAEVADLLDAILRAPRLFELLRGAEKAGQIWQGAANALDAARRHPSNPYLITAQQIMSELRLTLLTRGLRREGRTARPRPRARSPKAITLAAAFGMQGTAQVSAPTHSR